MPRRRGKEEEVKEGRGLKIDRKHKINFNSEKIDGKKERRVKLRNEKKKKKEIGKKASLKKKKKRK